jgi:hypothetical protein
LRFFRLLLDTLYKLVHKLHIILEVKLVSFESLFIVLYGILKLGSLLLLDYDIHLRKVNLLLLLQKVMNRLLLFCIVPLLPFSNARTRNFLSLLPCAGTLVMKSPS